MSDNNKRAQRIYKKEECAVFRKTQEQFGGLSNMAGGFPVVINGIEIRTVEALYQACRFPHLPEVQKLIISQKSPMTAKMKGKPHRKYTREDWDQVKIAIMRWCLRVKLLQNWNKFGNLLLETGDIPIVEESRKDSFWGAKLNDDNNLVGYNILGRLLMELREEYKSYLKNDKTYFLKPLEIKNFLLYGLPIEAIYKKNDLVPIEVSKINECEPMNEQLTIFDTDNEIDN